MDYQIIRSRRKTISLEITPRGEVLVRCPSRMKNEDIRHFVESKSPWIQRHLQKLAPNADLPLFTQTEMDAMANRLKELLPQKLSSYARQLNVTYGRITIRCQHTRWGSCSQSGNLNFNCLLALVPEEVLDYVIVHELCHRKEMNHSPRFWAEVEAVLPNYTVQKQWLKDNGNRIMARLP